MADVEKALVSTILATSAITTIIGDRIYPERATQGAAAPLIVYREIDAIPASAMDTVSTLLDSRFQFDAWGKSRGEARDLAKKLRSSLDGLSGSIFGVSIWGIIFLDRTGDYDESVSLYRVSQDFSVSHTAT